MQMTYDEWYTQTAAFLLGSDFAEAFVENCLTKCEAMHQPCQLGHAAAEVLMHVRKQCQLDKEAEAQRIRPAIAEEAERGRKADEEDLRTAMRSRCVCGIRGDTYDTGHHACRDGGVGGMMSGWSSSRRFPADAGVSLGRSV